MSAYKQSYDAEPIKFTSYVENGTAAGLRKPTNVEVGILVASLVAILTFVLIIVIIVCLACLLLKKNARNSKPAPDYMEKGIHRPVPKESISSISHPLGFYRQNASFFGNGQYQNANVTENTLSFGYSERPSNTSKLNSFNTPWYNCIRNKSNLVTTVSLEGDQTVVKVVQRTCSDVGRLKNSQSKNNWNGYRTIDGSYNRGRNNRLLFGLEKEDCLKKDLRILPLLENLTERIIEFKGLTISLDQHSGKSRKYEDISSQHLSTDTVEKTPEQFSEEMQVDTPDDNNENINEDHVQVERRNNKNFHEDKPNHTSHGIDKSEQRLSISGQSTNCHRNVEIEHGTDADKRKTTINYPILVTEDESNQSNLPQNNENQTENKEVIHSSSPSVINIPEQDINITGVKYTMKTLEDNADPDFRKLIAKDLKINNVNIHEDFNNVSNQISNITHIPPDISLNSGSPNYKQFRHNGGHWSLPESDVHLKIPTGAVPKNAACDIYREIHTDLALYQRYLREDECFISPVPQFQCAGLKKFEKHVTIEIPHCLTSESQWKYVRVQYGDIKNNIPFQEAVQSPGENNLKPDVYFTVDPKYIVIHSTHFTEFLCSSSHGITGFSSFHTLQLEAMVFGRYSNHGEPEIQLRVYVIDTLHQIVDMKQRLINQQREDNFHWRQSYSIKSPDVMFPNTEINMLMEPQNTNWTPICGLDGTPHSQLGQSRQAKEIILCQERKYSPSAIAEYVLVFTKETQRVNYFKGNLKLLIKQTEEPEKKSRRWYQRWRSNISEYTAKVLEFQTNMWINFPFEFQLPQISIDINFDDLSEVFDYIARCLPQEQIRPLVRKLGYTTADWQAIEESCPKMLREQKYQLLEKYRQKTGPEFNLNIILKFLEDEGLYKMADVIKNSCTLAAENKQDIDYIETSCREVIPILPL